LKFEDLEELFDDEAKEMTEVELANVVKEETQLSVIKDDPVVEVPVESKKLTLKDINEGLTLAYQLSDHLSALILYLKGV
jgi:hypothetical protein